MKKLFIALSVALCFSASAKLKKTEIPAYCEHDSTFAQALEKLNLLPAFVGDNNSEQTPSKTILAINPETNKYIFVIWFQEYKQLCAVSDGAIEKINSRILNFY